MNVDKLNEDLTVLLGNSLDEKYLLIGNGQRFGQVLFVVGGAGSGKGDIQKFYVDRAGFKIRDVDEWKTSFLKLADKTDKHAEIKGMDLGNPEHTSAIHRYVDDLGVKEKTLTALLKGKDPRRLPNILFDISGKKLGSITEVIEQLKLAGYVSKNIHLLWVFVSYSLAGDRNALRPRKVSPQTLFDTHHGAMETMMYILYGGGIPRSLLDGDITIILNDKEIADATIFRVKKQGREEMSLADFNKELQKNDTISSELRPPKTEHYKVPKDWHKYIIVLDEENLSDELSVRILDSDPFDKIEYYLKGKWVASEYVSSYEYKLEEIKNYGVPRFIEKLEEFYNSLTEAK